MTRIYFGSNRNKIKDASGKIIGFGKNFSENGLSDLCFGQAMVENGKIVSLDVLPDEPGEGSKALFAEIRAKMAEQGRDTLINLHGYAVPFEAAIVGGATIKDTYKDANLNVFVFSWPSDGQNFPPQAYADDRHDAKCSGEAMARGMMKLLDFLDDGIVCGRRVYLLAHSMGNYAMRFMLQALIAKVNGQLPRPFEGIFSMAADEDNDALELDDKWKRLPELTKHLHIYFNNHDHALNISDVTKNNPDRMGSNGPLHPFGLDRKVTLVDVSRTENFLQAVSSVGHSYFVEQPLVVADVLQVIAGAEPDQIKGRKYIDAKNCYVISS